MIYAVGHFRDGLSFHIGAAPVGGGLEQGDLLRKGEDDIRELQSLGLVDGHHAHGGAGIRRGDLRVRPFPVTEEGGEVVAAGSGPVQEEVHEGLHVGNLRVEGSRIRVPETAQEGFRQFRERMIVVRKVDSHLSGQKASDGSVLGRVGAVHQRELRHEPAHGHGGFHEQGIV